MLEKLYRESVLHRVVSYAPFFIRTYIFFLQHIQNKIIAKLLAVFFTATCFALPQNKTAERGVLLDIIT